MHIESLTMMNVFLNPDDPNIPVEQRGQSTLKALTIKDSYIDAVALKIILALPKALRSLVLDHRPDGYVSMKEDL